MSARHFVSVAALVAGSICPLVAAQPIVFSDGTFNDADWSIDRVTATGTAATPTGVQVSSGGNPGEFRRAGHNSFNRQLVTWHMRSGATYVPAVSGALASIDFSVDIRAVQNLAGVNIGVSLAIEQGGNYYYQPFTFLINNSASWATRTITLTASDFGQYPSISLRPDFSAGAAPLHFGLAFSNDNANNLATRIVDVDNWQATLRPVPTPGSAGLVMLGALLGTRRRR